jgi:hypothetical protein
MKILYILLLLISISSAQMVDTLEYVWLYMDNPNYSEVIEVKGMINGSPYNRQVAELDSVSDSTWGIQFDATTHGPFKFNEVIYATAEFTYVDTAVISGVSDTCHVFLAGDFNDDNRVNGADLEEIKKVFGRTGVGYEVFPDMNRDGRVNGADVQVWKEFNGRVWVPDCN